jgi:N-acetylneuraminate synthase
MTLSSNTRQFMHGDSSLWAHKSLYDLYVEAATPWEWQPKLKKIANTLGLDLFSSPFDVSAVDFLKTMDVPAYKIASFELIDLPLLRHVAATGKPIILSTGMATIAEIDEAVQILRECGTKEIALLKCVSAYPAAPKDMNLATLPHMADMFQCPVGLSDHSLSLAVPISAAVLGGCIIEKHLTLSRKSPTPDAGFSLEPEEFTAMVKEVRIARQSVGRVKYSAAQAEKESLSFRRSLYITMDLRAGDCLDQSNCRSIRPGGGLEPKHLDLVLGKRIKQNVKTGTPLTWDLLFND